MSPHHLQPRPRGSITVVALVCLLVIMTITAGLLRMARSQRSLLINEEHTLQADWLAESGLDRAAARLAADASYRGETWPLAAADLSGPEPGVVTITVETPEDKTSDRRRAIVTVVADYPVEPRQRVRSRKQVLMKLGSGRPGGSP
jgi:hypothetical protein